MEGMPSIIPMLAKVASTKFQARQGLQPVLNCGASQCAKDDSELMQRNRTFRPATIEDANLLAELINFAGEGMPLYLWGQMAEPGEAAWDVGCRRAARCRGPA